MNNIQLFLLKKMYLKLKFSEPKINEILPIRNFRKIDKGNSISYDNVLYSFYNAKNQRLEFKEKSLILILKTLDNRLIAKYYGKNIILKPTKLDQYTTSQKTSIFK